MPKKTWTPQERKAFADKMRAARANKQNQSAIKQSDQEAEVANETVAALLKRIEELEKKQFFQPPQQQVTSHGVRGTVVKFSLDPKYYPDPRERLAAEPKLEQQAFKHWFVLKWEIGKVNYQTIDRINITEPKFRLELWKRTQTDDNEPTDKIFRVHKMTFFEDPEAAIQLATDRGHDVPEELVKDFLDEMRYLRCRDWLFEIFWPPKMQRSQVDREEVIGNRLVPVVELNSADSIDVMSRL